MVSKGITICVVIINFTDKHPMFWNRSRAVEKMFLCFFLLAILWLYFLNKAAVKVREMP